MTARGRRVDVLKMSGAPPRHASDFPTFVSFKMFRPEEREAHPMVFEDSTTPRWPSTLAVYRDVRRRLTVILNEDQYRWLCEIEQALSCRTWGELRTAAPPDVYLEILDFAGFGELADILYETLASRGTASWPALIVQWQKSTGERLPLDGSRFDAERLEPVLGGAYPPDPWILMADVLPRRLLHMYERAWQETTALGIDDRDIVATLLTDLSRLGAVMRNVHDPHERARRLSAAS